MGSLPLPLRIALAAVLVLLGAWTVLLRPGAQAAPEPVTPPAPPAQVAQAAPPADAAAAAKVGGAAPAPVKAEPARPEPARSAPAAARPEAPADPSAPVLAALDEGRAAVLLFTDGRAPEDREARTIVEGAGRRGGRVLVLRRPMSEVGRFQAITRGVAVVASPTILVIGPSRTARSITGLTTGAEVEQAIADALDLKAEPLGAVRYARATAVRRATRTCDTPACITHFTAANDVCLTSAQTSVTAAATPGMAGLTARRSAAVALAASFAAVQAPGPQGAAHTQAAGILRRRSEAFGRALTGVDDPVVANRRVRSRTAIRAGATQLRRLGYAACA